ncbi:hypothetical protein [Streptomyces sp. NPDC020681]|uniref:hypothetical protein n=1 Tax=Streptomyces sp. NPDC020681 TaxID=3365083 RepID=UPI00378ABDA0
MTFIDRTPTEPENHVRGLSRLTAVTSMLSVIAVAGLALTGHPEAAVAAAIAGGAAAGVNVTVNIRR